MTVPSYPIWMPDPQAYSIDQERYRHDEAMALFGEYAIFVLLWNINDFNADLVDRCPDCYVVYGKIAETYGQASKERCEACYGTTFEGGYRAKIVRSSIWDFNEDAEREHSKGEVTLQKASVQSVSDFRLRTGDFILRGDGTRWRAEQLGTNHLRTGFDMPTTTDTPLGYNYGDVVREMDNSVAHMVLPADLSILDVPFQRYPQDWSAVEDVVGYLTSP